MTETTAGAVLAAPQDPTASWAGGLLTQQRSDARRAALALGSGLGASSILGLALGLAEGPTAMLHHALAVPLCIAAIAALVVPALYILLSLVGARTDLSRTVSALSRGVFVTGLLYAGFAPLTGLYLLGSPDIRLLVGLLVLIGGLGAGGAHLLLGIADVNADGLALGRLRTRVLLCGAGLFGYAVALRVWFAMLPVLGVH